MTIFEALREARRPWLPLLAISLFINLLALTSPIYMIQVYHRVLASYSVETLVLLTVFAAIALMTFGALEAARGAMLVRLGQWIEYQSAPGIFSNTLAETVDGGSVGAQPLRDIAELRSFVGSHLKTLLDLPFAPIFLIAAFILHPVIGIAIFVTALVMIGLTLWNDRLTRAKAESYASKVIEGHTLIETSLRNARTIRAMNMAPAIVARWREIRRPAELDQLAATDSAALFSGLIRFLRLFAQTVVLGLGAYLVLLGEFNAGGIIAGSILLGRALAPIDTMLSAWRSFTTTRSALDRLQRQADDYTRSAHTKLARVPEGRIQAQQLCFQPAGADRYILRDIDFSIEPGEVMLVIGPSGAGKTTLARVVAGAIRPSSGSLIVDGVDVIGQNLSLGPAIGYLPQESELFAGSIRDNVARMSLAPDEELVEASVAASGLSDLVARLPDGLDTMLGPGGGFLSGGQRQRVALARSLYGDPKILVLDEPSAHLDDRGDVALRHAIGLARERGISVLVVSHDLSLLEIADTCLLIVNGETRFFKPAREVQASFGTSRDKLAFAEGATAGTVS